ncbi:GerAB/ArcD/ProY family transporter [Paenibacillus allorhizosphaerae]|uniref:Spore germination protein YndE n=1 Tax=Paenibacillus allorhizosphaerae TaxID=2849866 RepID=A0ABM8VT56_9BACL|nr:GerAB/ArcD/ProY family transporter [Paenibacillus allorhizosphaerae]CAG7657222.1 Spore germination protein YndE [Paenibacillus allorhizosphaerae]
MQRITQLQLGLLIIIIHFTTIVGFIVPMIADVAAYRGWLALLAANVSGLLVAYISVTLAKRRPHEFLAHYGHALVGRWLHIAIMVLFSFFFLHLASLILRNITDFLVQIYLPSTPQWVVAAIFVFVISIGVRSGIEVIFRCASGFFFIIFSVASLNPFLVGRELNYERAIALITHLQASRLVGDTYPYIAIFGEMFAVLFIFPYLARSDKTFRTLLWSSFSSLLFIETYFIMCLLLLGSHLTAQLTYPVLEMIRFIRIGDFLENLDPIVVAIWISGLFIKLSFLLYISVLIVSQLFGLKDTRPFSFSFGAILLTLSVHAAGNSTELNHFIMYVWPTYALLVESMPLIYLLMALFRNRRSAAS